MFLRALRACTRLSKRAEKRSRCNVLAALKELLEDSRWDRRVYVVTWYGFFDTERIKIDALKRKEALGRQMTSVQRAEGERRA